MPFCLVTGQFVPEKSNIWRDCVDGYYDWVKVKHDINMLHFCCKIVEYEQENARKRLLGLKHEHQCVSKYFDFSVSLRTNSQRCPFSCINDK